MSSLIEHIRRAASRDCADIGDDELLGKLIDRSDETALAELVRRHGPMVWGVCRRLLTHHDAEDAFQATFLVLVRKAVTVAPRTMVANWLYGVARQSALHARRSAARRRNKEVQVETMPEPVAVQHAEWNEFQTILDEEIFHLPTIYRAVVVMCELEGRTRKEVASELGVPEGTVGGRLVRARALLAKRLALRGVALSSWAVAAFLAEESAASAPTALTASTIKVASQLATGHAAGDVSGKVVALTEGVMKAMFLSKIKLLLTGIVVVGFVLMGTAVLPYRTATAEPDQSKPATVKQTEKPAKEPEKAADSSKKLKMLIASKGGRTQIRLTVGDTTYSAEADELEYDEERGSLMLKGKGVLITAKGKDAPTTLQGEVILVHPIPDKPLSKDPTVGKP